jgi:hypothetical protein
MEVMYYIMRVGRMFPLHTLLLFGGRIFVTLKGVLYRRIGWRRCVFEDLETGLSPVFGVTIGLMVPCLVPNPLGFFPSLYKKRLRLVTWWFWRRIRELGIFIGGVDFFIGRRNVFPNFWIVLQM